MAVRPEALLAYGSMQLRTWILTVLVWWTAFYTRSDGALGAVESPVDSFPRNKTWACMPISLNLALGISAIFPRLTGPVEWRLKSSAHTN
jgi:hypothetical protein